MPGECTAEVLAELNVLVAAEPRLLESIPGDFSAWLASHAENPSAREFGAAHTQGTVRLAEDLLRGKFLA